MGGMGETVTTLFGITRRAAEKALQLGGRDGYPEGYLRVRVLAGGCSGFTYKLGFEHGPAADDNVIDEHGLKVLIDPKSLPIVRGSTLEFTDALLGGGFKVNNPQAIHECACGESFSV
jgi:iron-sulfur cluster assembly protein